MHVKVDRNNCTPKTNKSYQKIYKWANIKEERRKSEIASVKSIVARKKEKEEKVHTRPFDRCIVLKVVYDVSMKFLGLIPLINNHSIFSDPIDLIGRFSEHFNNEYKKQSSIQNIKLQIRFIVWFRFRHSYLIIISSLWQIDQVKRPTCDKSASCINGFPIFAIQLSKSRIKANATITPRIPSWVRSCN